MDAELERNLLVRPCTFPDRYGELDGFKVQEISGQLVSGKCLRGRPLVEIGFAGEGDRLDALLLVVKQCIRQVAKFCQAMRLNVRLKPVAQATR